MDIILIITSAFAAISCLYISVIMFSNIEIKDIKTHTLYFKDNKVITRQSFEWHADGNFSNNHIHTSVHLNYYWKNDKVNKIVLIFDSENYLNEELLFNKQEN